MFLLLLVYGVNSDIHNLLLFMVLHVPENVLDCLQNIYSETCDMKDQPMKPQKVVLYARWSFIRSTNVS